MAKPGAERDVFRSASRETKPLGSQGDEGLRADRRGLLLGTLAAGAGVLGAGAAHAADSHAPNSQQHAGDTAQTEADSQPAGTPSLESKLDGKLAVVTGAARGIGRSIAVEFAANGADVVGLDICGPASADTLYPHSTRADLNETERLVKSHGRRFMPVVADIRDIAALRAAAASVAAQMGQVHIVVADAGIQLFKPLLEMSDAQWHDVIDVNLSGTANTIRAFGPALVTGGGGRIIVVASMQGCYGTKNGSSYSASKWGIIGLMKSAALELGASKITVNAVVPGLIDTPMTRNETRWKLAIAAGSGDIIENPTEEQAVAALAVDLDQAKLLAHGLLVFLIIVVNFQSWLDPFVVISALPAALAGATWSLFLTGTPLSVPALTGAIMGMGTATANTVLVVDFARAQLADHGDAVAPAIEAGYPADAAFDGLAALA